jgi:isocitrate/isopropylmalate dehydrogenase
MSLVESVGGRDFTFSLNSSELGRQRTSNSLEDETTSQGGDKRLKQHDGSLFGVSFARPKKRGREGGKSDLLSKIRRSSHTYTNLVPVNF